MTPMTIIGPQRCFAGPVRRMKTAQPRVPPTKMKHGAGRARLSRFGSPRRKYHPTYGMNRRTL